MPSLKEIREQRAAKGQAIRAMHADFTAKASADKRDDWTPEEDAKWKALNGEFDTLDAQVKREEERESRLQRLDEVDAEKRDKKIAPTRMADPVDTDEDDDAAMPTDEDRANALQGWILRASGRNLKKRHVEACRKLRLNPNARHFDVRMQSSDAFARTRAARERRDLSSQVGASGAYTVPEGFVANLDQAMLDFSGIRQVAEVMRTSTGQPLPWPTADDTSNTGEIIGESASIGSSVDPTFGQTTFYAYKFSSKLVKVPVELMEDSAFNLAAILGTMLGERIGRIQNTRMTTGTGVGQPRGIITAASLGKTAASATAIAWSEIDDLIHSVDPAYRNGQGVGFMFHDSIAAELRKLTDGMGRPLWLEGPNGGLPNTLKAYPYWINQAMASTVASTNKTILFGQLSKYKIREVGTIRLRRLVERYADTDQEGFVAFVRADGNLIANGGPVKFYQQA